MFLDLHNCRITDVLKKNDKLSVLLNYMSMLRYREQNILKLVILGQFRPFTPLKTPKNKILKKWKNFLEISSFYTCVTKITIWCMVPEIWSETDRIFCYSGSLFTLLPPYGPRKPKFWENWKKKKKKTPRDIIILHKCPINDNHMMYGYWDMKCDKQFFVILDWFLPFYSPNNPKN